MNFDKLFWIFGIHFEAKQANLRLKYSSTEGILISKLQEV
jgi:hypothetical protein